MPNRKGPRNAYFFFVLEKLPELKRRGLNVTGVADAVPHCSEDWAKLSEIQKEKYAEMARQWKARKAEAAGNKSSVQVPASLYMQPARGSASISTSLSGTCDQAVLENTFYFLNIFSHGELPPHCSKRFLPCEIGCVKYSLKDGIIADFHRFIDPGSATHRIPISGFELATVKQSVVICELYSFIQPCQGIWPPVYCKSDGRFRISWCLKHMAREAGAVNQLALLSVEDLVVELYHLKLQKEPSKTWVHQSLDTSMWDYSSSIRCQWHEENDILFCALAACKKIAYCISHSLANMYGVPLTVSHLPLSDKDTQNTTNPKIIALDGRHYQKVMADSAYDKCFGSLNQNTVAVCYGGEQPSGAKMRQMTTGRGRGVTRFFDSISEQSCSNSLAVSPVHSSVRLPVHKT